MLHWLIPYEFSPTLLAAWLLAALLYLRGARKRRVPRARQAYFWIGMALSYFALLTYFDFYALHQFFVDRIQQVLMHHLAPLLIMLAYPLPVWRAALPLRARSRMLRPLARSIAWRALATLLFNPLLATVTFVAVVLVWLIPRMMTLAMLDWRLYWLMNVSMLASGLIYWGLVLDHRPRPPARMAPGLRVLSPALSMTPQILVGAIITFSKTDLYPIFSICGRAFDINVMTDQQYGGLITWVPAAVIEAIAALLALRIWMHLSADPRGVGNRVATVAPRRAP
ncbi:MULTISPECIES: cytochrome c oxidase assembly protein [Metallibacterium]|jgi:putative membrane protein|uniref:cytochrome c oxidase assembly protein n=1 Tax=Metallibacterium TaxID=1218803 RepID=UPI002618942E|nr:MULTISPECIES: cytochrome c oxidase assembly protein [Metallibacterium]MBW8076428.1 cytochrome c oxidase assembly protein [Metallibacterium scheffleri]